MAAMRTYQPYLMLSIAFVAQNIATGLIFGSFGLLIGPLSRDLGSSSAQISLAIAAVLLVSSCAGPLVGRLVDRWSLRGTMLIGAALGAAGFYIAAHAHSAPVFLASYGILVGLSYAMIGFLPANKIVALWFPNRFGRASAVVSLPLAVAVFPPLFGIGIEDFGWRSLLELFAGAQLVLLLLLTALRKPPQIASAAAGTALDASAPAPFRRPIFWAFSVAIGLTTTSGIVASTHIIPFAQSISIGAARAALLVSLSGFASIFGAIFFGWLADRASPIVALLAIAASGAAIWFALMTQSEFMVIALLTLGIGFGGGGLMPAVGALIARIFPAGQFGSAFGQMNFATLPYTVAAAPLIGLCYDRFGNYRQSFLVEASFCVAASLLLIALARRATTVRP